MTEPWAQSYQRLSDNARTILSALAILDLPAASISDLSAISGLGAAHVSAALRELSSTDWGSPTEDGAWEVTPSANRLLAQLTNGDLQAARSVVNRFASYLRETLDSRPCVLGAREGTAIVATVRTAARYDLPSVALRLAMSAWRAVTPTGDRRWWHSLADEAEAIAIAEHSPDRLIELLDVSGSAIAEAGDTDVADNRWRRAWALTERLGERSRSADFLARLGALRRTAGSLGGALTIFQELVRLRAEQGDQLGLAEASTEMATTLMKANRLADADEMLDQAADVLPPTDVLAGPTLVRRAKILITIGRSWEQRGARPKAVSYYRRALDETPDLDDELAEKARGLLGATATS